MFDEYHHHSHSHSSRVTVEEKRAPTDESVRLLREMEAAAQKKVDATIRISDTPVECVVHSGNDHMNCQTLYRIMAKVNGRMVDVTVRIKDYEPMDREKIIDKIRDDFAQALAAAILSDAFRKSFSKFDQPF